MTEFWVTLRKENYVRIPFSQYGKETSYLVFQPIHLLLIRCLILRMRYLAFLTSSSWTFSCAYPSNKLSLDCNDKRYCKMCFTFFFFSLLFLDFLFLCFLSDSLLSSESVESRDFFFLGFLPSPNTSAKVSGLKYICALINVSSILQIHIYQSRRGGELPHADGTPMVLICSLSFLR